jgi:hypothetical protein
MNAETDWADLRGEVFLHAVLDDGTEVDVPPEIAADGNFSYLVPEGVAEVAGRLVQPGDTVSGKFEISDV